MVKDQSYNIFHKISGSKKPEASHEETSRPLLGRVLRQVRQPQGRQTTSESAFPAQSTTTSGQIRTFSRHRRRK